jgi:hypothetical protein
MASRIAKLPDYEAYRERLIAFYRHESPWMTQKLENLRLGYPLSIDDMHVIDGLMAVEKLAA